MANGNGTPDPTANCGVGIDNRRRIMTLEASDRDQWSALHDIRRHMDESMERLRNRLPVWATLAMSILTGLVGVLLALAIQAQQGG